MWVRVCVSFWNSVFTTGLNTHKWNCWVKGHIMLKFTEVNLQCSEVGRPLNSWELCSNLSVSGCLFWEQFAQPISIQTCLVPHRVPFTWLGLADVVGCLFYGAGTVGQGQLGSTGIGLQCSPGSGCGIKKVCTHLVFVFWVTPVEFPVVLDCPYHSQGTPFDLPGYANELCHGGP